MYGGVYYGADYMGSAGDVLPSLTVAGFSTQNTSTGRRRELQNELTNTVVIPENYM
jgi:hypothetical protein